MNNENEKDGLSTTQQNDESEPSSIFPEISTDMTGYDKNLKRARIYLYIVAALQLGVGIYEYFKYDTFSELQRLLLFAIDGGVGLIFIALTVWSYKKPAPAFMLALAFYVIVQVFAMFSDPTMIYKGLILKILIVVTLVKAIQDARDFEAFKTSYGIPDIS